MRCAAPMLAAFTDEAGVEGYHYRCEQCGAETIVSLDQLNDPDWRSRLMGARAG